VIAEKWATRQYASLTIQTSPAETQAAIQYIKTHHYAKWSALGDNCTTTCSRILRKLKLYSYAPLTPDAFFVTLADQYSTHSQFQWPKNVPQNGVEYGNPRAGYNAFDVLFKSIQPMHEEVTHKICFVDKDGKKVCQ